MESFVAAVRKAALPAIWSQGVKLVREKSVSLVSKSESEATLRVRVPSLAVAPTVTLYLEDEEWSCDCDAKTDPCAHVTASAIALSQGELAAAPSGADKPARLVYRFAVRDRRLVLGRVVVHPDGREEKLGATLGSEVARGRLPGGLTPTHEDVLVDRILGSPAREAIALGRIRDVLEAVASAEVTFEGQPIKVSGELLVPRAVVEDAPNGGFILRIVRDPSIEKVVALAGGTLRALGETNTTGEWLEKLPLERRFEKSAQTELVTRILPDLEKTIPVDIVTSRLAKRTQHARPRIAFDLSHHGHALSVLPTLVYGDPPIARVDGDEVISFGKEVPVRRIDAEKAALLRLREELNLVPGRRVHFDGHEAARFAARLRAFEGAPEVAASATLVPRLIATADTFDVVFEEVDEETGEVRRADPQGVLRAWRDGLDLVPLDDGGWAPLPADWLAKFGDRVADLLAARNEEKKLPTVALPELGALCAALDAPPPPALAGLAPLLEGFERIPPAVLPSDLKATLRDYQRAGIDWLAFLRDANLGGILADDMGLGKTLQTIATLEGRCLVVCPRSVVYNWEAEIARFRPSLKTSIFHGAGRELDESAGVTLTTYAVLRLDQERLSAVAWDTVVLDEAQAIKNPTSQTARAAFALSAKHRVALSGTPVENRLDELWSIMHFANPGLLGGRSDFQDRIAGPISSGDASAGTRLRAKIRPFVLRRLKKDVLRELPPRTDAVLHVALEENERAIYDAVRAATKKEIAARLAGSGSSVMAALEALLRLRQAACHPALVPGQQAESSSKVERLLEALEEAVADGHKALVFSQWTSLLDLVEPHLQNASIGFTRLDGSTKDRAAVVAELEKPNGPPVMLISLKAGGTGLNLVAADHVFLLDPWWNPAVEDQAADRAHRIGQERPVILYRMVARDTVEERILALQEKKRAIADVALGDADHAGGITKEELLALLD